jgi:hypothetical protein
LDDPILRNVFICFHIEDYLSGGGTKDWVTSKIIPTILEYLHDGIVVFRTADEVSDGEGSDAEFRQFLFRISVLTF